MNDREEIRVQLLWKMSCLGYSANKGGEEAALGLQKLSSVFHQQVVPSSLKPDLAKP